MLEQTEGVKHFVHFILAIVTKRRYYRLWRWSPVISPVADFHTILLINGCIILPMRKPCTGLPRLNSVEAAWM
jgi:hypothetical protein